MGDLDKNIYRKENPYEKIIVNPIEEERKGKGEGFKSLTNSTKTQSLATLVSFFKKILSTLSSRARGEGHSTTLQGLLYDMQAFKKLLEILAVEDTSHHPEFTQHLSEVWHNLLEECNTMGAGSAESAHTVNRAIFFISQVQNFPLGADHTLGYYFSNYAGKDWIPFPFMELLQGLHFEYQASPTISVLHNWITLLEEILPSQK